MSYALKFKNKLYQIPFVVVIFWLSLYLKRIWQLGFLQDDWIAVAWWQSAGLFSKWALNSSALLFSSRPIMIPIYGILPGAIGMHTEVWQVLLITLCLFVAIKIYKILKQLLGVEGYSFAADLLSAIFLVLPWTLGFTGWVPGLMILMSLWFYLISMQLALQELLNKQLIFKCGVFYLLSLFSYEAFFFQFFLIPFLRLYKKKFIKKAWPEAFQLYLVYILASVISISVNRIVYYLYPIGTTKALNYSWLKEGILRGYALLWNDVTIVQEKYAALFQDNIKLLLVMALVGLVILLRNRSKFISSLTLYIILLISVGLCIALYGVAGYAITGVGTMSRTTAAISLILILFGFLIFQSISKYLLLRIITICFFGIILFVSAVNLNEQQAVWSAAWLKMKEKIVHFPAEQLSRLPNDTIVVYIGDTEVGNIPYLSHTELTAAVAVYFPETRIDLSEVTSSLVGNYTKGNLDTWTMHNNKIARLIYVKGIGQKMHYDGLELSHELEGYWSASYPTKNLYLWKPDLSSKLLHCEPGCKIE